MPQQIGRASQARLLAASGAAMKAKARIRVLNMALLKEAGRDSQAIRSPESPRRRPGPMNAVRVGEAKAFSRITQRGGHGSRLSPG